MPFIILLLIGFTTGCVFGMMFENKAAKHINSKTQKDNYKYIGELVCEHTCSSTIKVVAKIAGEQNNTPIIKLYSSIYTVGNATPEEQNIANKLVSALAFYRTLFEKHKILLEDFQRVLNMGEDILKRPLSIETATGSSTDYKDCTKII